MHSSTSITDLVPELVARFGQEMTARQITSGLRDDGFSFRVELIESAAEIAVDRGQLTARNSPRGRMYRVSTGQLPLL